MQALKKRLSDISAQDLLGKSHEELVLLLIHLRRQSASLTETIEGSKSELAQMETASMSDANKAFILGGSSEGENSSLEHHRRMIDDLRSHIQELDEKRARTFPMISLVDNMVKLGSLYKGPEDAPLSHRIRNIPVGGPFSNQSRNPKNSSSGRSDHHLSQQNRKDIQVGGS